MFHNLTGYDTHLFIKKLKGEITCIPNTEERYVSFSNKIIAYTFLDKEGKEVQVKREVRFLDSFRFMSSSLDELSGNLKHCPNLSKHYSGTQYELLRQKGVYPYEYVDSVTKLNDTELPPKEAFYSRLNDSCISSEDYDHAKKVWIEFGCKTLRDYHNLYNKSDVLLLADVFENFRDVSIQNYGLDPAWYYTSPGLAWDSMLKMTKAKLELLSDYEIYQMINQGIRGGVSTISHRYGKANNKYMGDAYDETKTIHLYKISRR